MALQVASLLDQVALWPQWVEKTTEALNSALGEISVNPGYCVLITISNRSYLLSSGTTGQLQITQLTFGIPGAAQFTQALASCKVRVVIDGEAWDDWRNSDDWSGDMMQKRLLKIEGDAGVLSNLDRELGPYLSSLSAKVEDKGPKQSELQKVLDEHNNSLRLRRELDLQERSQMMAYSKDAGEIELYTESEPILNTVRGWCMFSAGSTMFGNMGQSNYVAANCILDQLTFMMRQTSPYFEALCLMWGAVAGIGMRWKAFASADTLLQVDNSAEIMISAEEAQKCIGIVISGTACEWSNAFKPDAATLNYILAFKGDPRLIPGYDPWGKGRGGGVNFDNASWEKAKESVKDNDLEHKVASTEGVWLFAGRRVRLHGLVTSAELNEVKGTLVEEVVAGTWHVQLDGGADRLVNVRNLKTLAGVPLDQLKEDADSETSKLRDATSASNPESLAYSLAGTWTDWLPEDMYWDAKQQCFTLDVRLKSPGGFSIVRGKAGKRWKVQKKDWFISGEGAYQIRLFITDSGTVKKVDWVAPGAIFEHHRPEASPGINEDKDSTNKEAIANSARVEVAEQEKTEGARSQGTPSSASPPPHSYCLAGKWMDWVPKDMTWNPEKQCFTLSVYIESTGSGGFGICRGKAGIKWRSKKEDWTILGKGRYDIKLFIKDSGAIKKVEWLKAE